MTHPVSRFWLQRRGIVSALVGMGAKYLPTIKDQKASQRFQQKQNPLRKFKKAGATGAAKKGRAK
jgi:hypothetical protein